MATPGQDLIESAREALAIAEGKVVPPRVSPETSGTGRTKTDREESNDDRARKR